MGVDLIEQPVSAHDNAALVRLSQHIETAILADEAVATLTMVIAWRSRALPALMR
jgi:L-alanine-DL-glutamate epimerase-like enolase superfamily enzyme